MYLYEIVKAWLKDNGYDGLCHPDSECGCHIDDLMPCSPGLFCEAGHQTKAPKMSGYDFWIVPGKREEGDE